MMRMIFKVGFIFLLLVSAGCKRESPPEAVTLSITNIDSLSISLEWTPNTEDKFASYTIYRGETPGVTSGSKILATRTNRYDTVYIDSLLSPHHTYYYNVYVYNSDNKSTESNEVGDTTSGLSILTLGIHSRHIEVSQGNIFPLSVWIESVTDLFGVSFELVYDSTVVSADSLVVGDFLGTDVISFGHFSPDTASIAVTRKSGAGGVSGFGTIVYIYFHAVGTGTTPITFASDIALKKEDGSFVGGYYFLELWEAEVTVP